MYRRSIFGFALVFAACGGSDKPKDDQGDTGITNPSGESGDSNPSGEGSDTTPDTGQDSNDDGPPPPLPKYDVGAGGDFFCQGKDNGFYCDDHLAIECLDNKVESNNLCLPDICLEGTGCVTCLEGQYYCLGDEVLLCDATSDPRVWQTVATCDPTTQRCDIPTGSCVPIDISGTTMPTGVYYQFAEFLQAASPYLSGYDVDTWENRIYTVRGFPPTVDIYEVELLDSDGDGVFEPNQHPDNPDDMGPIEERVLTFIESIPVNGLSGGSSELYVVEDRLYHGGTNLVEYIFATGAETIISTPPAFLGRFSHIGFDDLSGIWYASTETNRRVYQMNPVTGNWGVAFGYPDLAGSHMDGFEVVTDPATFIPYVYVSDMTSDFIGQYRLDSEMGWLQENLFSYDGTVGVPVEGFGFGALKHFWATSGSGLYEIGGGDLQGFVDPEG